MMRLSVIAAVIAAALLPLVAVAQAPPPNPAAPAAPPVTPPADPQGFDYNAGGRRDPFVSLVRRGSDAAGSAAGPRSAGLRGLETAEVTLKGTLQSRDGFVGILQGSDNRTYIVRVGDRLLDGTIRSITANALVILQQVSDPLSLQKQREVRKTIRQTDEAR
jgi:Tfp pilus assembly protein PilP